MVKSASVMIKSVSAMIKSAIAMAKSALAMIKAASVLAKSATASASQHDHGQHPIQPSLMQIEINKDNHFSKGESTRRNIPRWGGL
jgi:hypothetical protein